jgi:hypothetical protein
MSDIAKQGPLRAKPLERNGPNMTIWAARP